MAGRGRQCRGAIYVPSTPMQQSSLLRKHEEASIPQHRREPSMTVNSNSLSSLPGGANATMPASASSLLRSGVSACVTDVHSES